jgi:hypothetical protein
MTRYRLLLITAIAFLFLLWIALVSAGGAFAQQPCPIGLVSVRYQVANIRGISGNGGDTHA